MRTTHPMAGKTVTLPATMTDPELNGQLFQIEDWWQNVSGQSWMDSVGNPACLKYAARSAVAGLPLNDEVVYGKSKGLGHLVHVSELEGC